LYKKLYSKISERLTRLVDYIPKLVIFYNNYTVSRKTGHNCDTVETKIVQ